MAISSAQMKKLEEQIKKLRNDNLQLKRKLRESAPPPKKSQDTSTSRKRRLSFSRAHKRATTTHIQAGTTPQQKKVIIDALNRIYAAEVSRLDPAIAKMQSTTLRSTVW